MPTIVFAEEESESNPLDMVEEMVSANDWDHQRHSDDELIIEVPGQWGDYRLYFFWQPDFCALQFCCRVDIRVPAGRRDVMPELLSLINERLWVGHFDIMSEEQMPVFRHTILMRGMAGVSPEVVEDIIDNAVTECERYYPALQTAIWGGKNAEEAVAAAILDPIGEA